MRELTAHELACVEKAIRLMILIKATTDSTSYLDAFETIDRRRRACGEAAEEARQALDMAFGLHWVPEIGGPVVRRQATQPGRILKRRARKGGK